MAGGADGGAIVVIADVAKAAVDVDGAMTRTRTINTL